MSGYNARVRDDNNLLPARDGGGVKTVTHGVHDCGFETVLQAKLEHAVPPSVVASDLVSTRCSVAVSCTNRLEDAACSMYPREQGVGKISNRGNQGVDGAIQRLIAWHTPRMLTR